jgi:hypothetical protein
MQVEEVVEHEAPCGTGGTGSRWSWWRRSRSYSYSTGWNSMVQLILEEEVVDLVNLVDQVEQDSGAGGSGIRYC